MINGQLTVWAHMGYLHIDNLYKNQAILMFRECYALEKIHGTSANLGWRPGAAQLHFHSGGEKLERFTRLFDRAALTEGLTRLFPMRDVTLYGEAYGGSQQRQAHRYGPELRFVVFDVLVGSADHGPATWLEVPQAAQVAVDLGLEFVHYRRVPTDVAALDAERDACSEQARRNGVAGDWPREGVVLRPLVEVQLNNGERVICKHKRDDERETAGIRQVADPARLKVLADAQAIALEWVTVRRLQHVLDKLDPDLGIERMREVIAAMQEDVLREGAGELVDSREARAAIGKQTAQLFRELLNRVAG